MKGGLQQKNLTRLQLTPQLRQSLAVLAMPWHQVEQQIDLLLSTNPLLERIDKHTSAINSNSLLLGEQTTLPAERGMSTNNIRHWLTGAEAFSQSASTNRSVKASELGVELVDQAATELDLYAHLSEQVQQSQLSRFNQLIAIAIIESLDEDGYLRVTDEEVINTVQFLAEQSNFAQSISYARVDASIEPIRKWIQTLEPIASASRNLSDCLLTQLKLNHQHNPLYALACAITKDHLTLAQDKHAKKLSVQLQQKQSEILSALALIRQLNPRPGDQYKILQTHYIRPDIMVKINNGQAQTSLSPGHQLSIRIQPDYHRLLRVADNQERQKLRMLYTQANGMLKAMQSRAATLLRVAQAIVDEQSGYFLHGPMALKPMQLMDLANRLELHQSTISRACAGKYLQSSWGIRPLKYFFSTSVSANTAATAIQHRIQALIDGEDPQKPLSDTDIVAQLHYSGLCLARRTVAKYRQQMNIPASYHRHARIHR